jgi:hypothetical protein
VVDEHPVAVVVLGRLVGALRTNVEADDGGAYFGFRWIRLAARRDLTGFVGSAAWKTSVRNNSS